jgi:tRNA(fMet)-specific endonuclease VapC
MPGNGRFLLDTNIIISLLEGDPGIETKLASSGEILIPAVAAGELYFGAAKSARSADNIFRIERFLSGRKILPCDLGVARDYGTLRQRLRVKGRPIPENDLWIAATAVHFGCTLVTRDRHFGKVEELMTVDWSAAGN